MSRGQPALLGAQLEEELTRVNVYEPQDTILSQKPQALYRDWQGSLERPLLLQADSQLLFCVTLYQLQKRINFKLLFCVTLYLFQPYD